MASISKTTRYLIGLAVVVAIIGGGAWYALRPRDRTVHGTVLALDPATRTATLRFVQRRTGKVYEWTRKVPTECQITLNGQPAQLADLRPGDEVDVRGRLYPPDNLVAQTVQAHRPTATASTSTPAAAPPSSVPAEH